MNKDTIINNLFIDTLKLAKTFLQEMGEFYPCATALDENGIVHPIEYENGEYPNTEQYLKEFETELNTRFETYAIGINVTVTKNGEKYDAIQIRIIYEGVEYESCFIPYKILKNGKFQYEEVYCE